MSGPPVALALAAGGARGAYQAGALLYFAEQGIRFSAVAGAGVGALNGAFYAQGDGSPGHLQALVDVWRRAPEAGLLHLSGKLLTRILDDLLALQFPSVARLLEPRGGEPVEILDPLPLARWLDAVIDYPRVCGSAVDLTFPVLPEIDPRFDVLAGRWRSPAYVTARELDPSVLRETLLATVATPLLLPSREVGEVRLSSATLSEPLPAKALYDRGARRIVSVFLADDTLQDRADFPGAWLLQIRPSEPIDMVGSALDLSPGAIEGWIERGYSDTRLQLGEAAEVWKLLRELRASGDRVERLADSLPDRQGNPGL